MNENAIAKVERMPARTTEPESVLASYTAEQVQILKTQIAPGVSDMELRYFLTVANKRGLDPFSRQIYAIMREQWDAGLRRRVPKMTIQTGIDGLRAIADRTGHYAPGDESWEMGNDGMPVSATVSVEKLVGGTWKRYSATAHWDEYAAWTKRDGQDVLAGLWAKMPKRMLAKCAEALALRKGWPEQMSGLYITEEMEQADARQRPLTRVVDAEVVPPADAAEPPPPADPLPSKTEAVSAAIKKKTDPAQAAFEDEVNGLKRELAAKLGRDRAAWEWQHTEALAHLPKSGKDLEHRRDEYLRAAYSLRDRHIPEEPTPLVDADPETPWNHDRQE